MSLLILTLTTVQELVTCQFYLLIITQIPVPQLVPLGGQNIWDAPVDAFVMNDKIESIV